ncbi:hypothetical protein QUA69_17360 [Microcoleus sp. LAD1_D1]|uniref:hypothetical protein n=1 Tax=Microcoleus sp. LAD1_D1 TaxID=2818812 RepID=UPI002FCF2B00
MAEAALRTNSIASYYSKLSIHRRSPKRMSGKNNIIEVAGSYPAPSTKRRGVAQSVERDAINLKSLT